MSKEFLNSAEKLKSAIENLWRNARKYGDCLCYGNERVVQNLSMVEELNWRGKSLCGNASSLMLEWFPEYAGEFGLGGAFLCTATASPNNTCFHHYNILQHGDDDPLICDLTISQYFSRPLDSLGGVPYFIGTRGELRDLIEREKERTWDFVQENFPEREFKSPWDFDFDINTDYDFRKVFLEHLKRSKTSLLLTESLLYAFEVTWGDKSRLLHLPSPLSAQFDWEGRVQDVVRERTPPLKDLVTSLTCHLYKRDHSPSLSR